MWRGIERQMELRFRLQEYENGNRSFLDNELGSLGKYPAKKQKKQKPKKVKVDIEDVSDGKL